MMNQNPYPISQPGVEPEFRSCFKCNYEGNVNLTICPRCGRRLHTTSNVRMRGGLLIFLGLFLTGLMSAVAIFVTIFLNQAAQQPGNTAKFKQDEVLFLLMYAIFGLVIAFGIMAIVTGIWMMVFGKRNRYLVWIMMAFIILAFIIGTAFRMLAR